MTIIRQKAIVQTVLIVVMHQIALVQAILTIIELGTVQMNSTNIYTKTQPTTCITKLSREIKLFGIVHL